MKPLKELYCLSYDSSGFNSGLIAWYNKLIDKTYDDLTAADVSRMIRQDVLKAVAIKKAIELFLSDPYDGEYCEGELLEVLISLDISSVSELYIERLKNVLRDVFQDYVKFEWSDDETKNMFGKNIVLMATKLELM